MRATTIQYKHLLGLPDEQRGRALAEAISFELQKPQILQDMMSGKSAYLSGQIKSVGATPQIEAPTLESIKSYLARKWTVSSDTPILANVAEQLRDWYHTNMPEIDTGYEALFQYLDLRESNQDHFSIARTNAGVSFKQVKPGEEVKIRRAITEDETIVKYLETADGVGLLDDWLRFQQFWKIDEVVSELRAGFYDRKAGHHYALFNALSSAVNVPFATDDAVTFNAAAASLLRALRGQGYGVGQNPGMYILTSPEQTGRINRMLMATSGSAIVAYKTMEQPISFSTRGVIQSTFIPSDAPGYYLVLPGRQIKRADWADFGVKSASNIYSSSTDWVARGKYNAVIGNAAQVRRVLFA